MAPIILDSNILIGYLNGDAGIIAALQQWRESGAALFISTISAIEALSLSTLTAADAETVEDFLNDFVIIPVELPIAKEAGKLRRKYGLSVPDSEIVATALLRNLPLATRDKQLKRISTIAIVGI